jgi:hypothetical protein
MALDAEALKSKHRQVRQEQPEVLRVRIHRAISWLQRAEQESSDLDARFLFLWICLNAAYASEFGFERSEREQTRLFVGKILARDTGARLHHALHRQFTGPIRALIDNRFVFEPFWKAMRDHDSSQHWEDQFAASKKVAMRAVMDKQTDVLLGIVLDRLYVLRNQVVHGGATWRSAANRTQLRDGTAILETIMPIVIDVMIDDNSEEFEGIAYPVISAID